MHTRDTIDREIFVVNKFSSVPYDDENLKHEYFSTSNNIIRTKLHFRYAGVTTIKQRENLTDEHFYEQKFPDPRYM